MMNIYIKMGGKNYAETYEKNWFICSSNSGSY